MRHRLFAVLTTSRAALPDRLAARLSTVVEWGFFLPIPRIIHRSQWISALFRWGTPICPPFWCRRSAAFTARFMRSSTMRIVVAFGSFP